MKIVQINDHELRFDSIKAIEKYIGDYNKCHIIYLSSSYTHQQALDYLCYNSGIAFFRHEKFVFEYANLDDKFIELANNLDKMITYNLYIVERVK